MMIRALTWLGAVAVVPLSSAAMEAGPADDLRALAESVQARCFECHAGSVTKGGLALDQVAGWAEGVDGLDPDDSEFFYRVTLPADDPDAMPPKGPRLEPSDLDSLAGWIRAGAPEPALRAALAVAAKNATTRAAVLERVRSTTGARIDERPPASAESESTLSITWSYSPEPPSEEKVAALAPVAGRVVELSLAGIEGPIDRWLASLPELPGLRRVHLERSSVTNDGVLALLNRAPAITYLNLHTTRVQPGVERGLKGVELILFGTAAFEADPSDLDPFASIARTYPRRILAADASKNRVALLEETAIGKPTVLWEARTEAIHDLQWLGETESGHGRVLYQESWQRVIEVDTATGEVLWSYDAVPVDDERVEIHSFERLPDGTTMVAESGRARIAFVNAQGQIAHSFRLSVDEPDAHHDTRLVQPTAAGTFLVAHERDGVIREYDRSGNVVWSYAVPLFGRERAPGHGFDAYGNQAFSAQRLSNGTTVIATGNGHSFLCVDGEGKLLWQIGQNDLDGVRFAWTTTAQELASGHLVLGNCHAGPDQPQAVEVDADGRLLWRFHDFDRFGNALTGFEVIEATGPTGPTNQTAR